MKGNAENWFPYRDYSKWFGRDLPNDPHIASSKDTREIWVAGILPGLVFGSLHFTAWDCSFPTSAESIAWKICSCVSLVCCFLYGLGFILRHYPQWTYLMPKRLHWELRNRNLLTLPYAVCRLVIIILAFVSLRSLPSGAYQTINWTQSLPHI